MATIVKPTPESIKLRELAKKVPLSKWVMPSVSEEVEEGREPLSVVTGAGALGPAAMTRAEAQQALIRPLFGHFAKRGESVIPVSPSLREGIRSLASALKVLKYLPEEEMASLDKILVDPSLMNAAGQYWPKHWRFTSSSSTIVMNPAQRKGYDTLAHEFAHHKTYEEARRLAEKMGLSPEQYQKAIHRSYRSNPLIWEQLADDISAVYRKPSGIGKWERPIGGTMKEGLYVDRIIYPARPLEEVPVEGILKELSSHIESMGRAFELILGAGK